jgi:hypothetical protein
MFERQPTTVDQRSVIELRWSFWALVSMICLVAACQGEVTSDTPDASTTPADTSSDADARPSPDADVSVSDPDGSAFDAVDDADSAAGDADSATADADAAERCEELARAPTPTYDLVAPDKHWPLPWKADEDQPTSRDGLELWPYDAPIANFSGRFVDSHTTVDHQYYGRPTAYQSGFMRTLRARAGVSVSEEQNRVYIMMGQTMAAYALDEFFARLLEQPEVIRAGSHSGDIVPHESYAQWDSYICPECPNSGWNSYVYIMDGQDRLWTYDYDDRGYVYVSYFWGMAVHEDTGQGAMPLVSFVADPQPEPGDNMAGPDLLVSLKDSSGKYYLVADTEIWDVTTPSAPAVVPNLDYGSDGDVHLDLMVDANGYVALAADQNTLEIYTIDALVSSGAPSATFETDPGFELRQLVTDGRDFFASQRYISPDRSTLSTAVVRYTFDGTAFEEQQLVDADNFSLEHLEVSRDYIATFGISSDTGATSDRYTRHRLFHRPEPQTLDEIDLDGYFERHYYGHELPDGYTYPPGYRYQTKAILPFSYEGRDYLVLSGWGLGDVYELERPCEGR